MVLTQLQKTIGLVAGGAFLVLCFTWFVYALGGDAGRARVTAEWERAKQDQLKQIHDLQAEIANRELRHRQETAAIADELRKTEATHEQDLAALRAEHADRLRASERRAAAYQRLAEDGPAACTRLAGHAARLDRALEEGRSLVVELGSTVEQRDSQLRLLGAQINTDRKLLGGH